MKNDSIAKSQRLQVIKESNERLCELRQHLSQLRTSHVSENKAMALKKKQYHDQAKKRNIISPSSPSPRNTEDTTGSEDFEQNTGCKYSSGY